MKTYQITLPDEVAAFVDRLLAEKQWDSLDDLVTYALSYVEAELESGASGDLEGLRRAIRVGSEQAERGEVAPLDLTATWARAQQRLAEEREAAHAASSANGTS